MKTGLFAVLTIYASSGLGQALPDFTSLVDENAQSIVNVNSVRRASIDTSSSERLDEILRYYFGDRFEDRPEIPDEQLREFQQRPSLGSGFIISSDGYIITNHHVVEDSEQITITLNDRREFEAQIIGSDVSSDLALLKIEAGNLKPVRLGNSASLKVGEWVLAIGSPMGLRFSVAAGIVSYMGRNIPNGTSGNYVSFIQTDVAINPGNSGGPLFNLDGEVIGINSQIFTSTGGSMGLSFAIPVDVAKNVVGQLKEKGVVDRGWMGVGINEVSQELADKEGLASPVGAFVNQVIEGSPAEAAGFKSGDVIVRFNGNEIISSGDLPFYVGLTAPQSDAEVQIIRNGNPMALTMRVGKLASGNPLALEGNTSGSNILGLMVTDGKSSDGSSALLVASVLSNTGREAGFQTGDVLLSLNGDPTGSVDEFNSVVSSLPRNQVIPALIEREDRQFFLTVTIPD
ncbi:MAG: Do family serine endopeptidase [Gammaproteobacteria bacterium]|nr:Do family serine endopeptidase [Gammaproteobacteria bacterium]